MPPPVDRAVDERVKILITNLISILRDHHSTESLMRDLIIQMTALSYDKQELENATRALRAAVAYFRGDDTELIRCSFCGNSRKKVRILLASDENIICEECVATAIETMSRQRFSFRLGFALFKAIASIGRFFTGR